MNLWIKSKKNILITYLLLIIICLLLNIRTTRAFSTDEHVEIGDKAFDEVYPFTLAFSNSKRPLYSFCALGNIEYSGVYVTFGDLVALAGDFLSTPEELLAQIESEAQQNHQSLEKREEFCRNFDQTPFAYLLYKKLGKRSNQGFSPEVASIAEQKFTDLALENWTHFLDKDNFDASDYWCQNEIKDVLTFPLIKDSETSYVLYHCRALREAYNTGRNSIVTKTKACTSDSCRFYGEVNPAILANEAFALHYLSDSFASGHVAVPRYLLKKLWNVDQFGYRLTTYIAERMARRIWRFLPDSPVANNLWLSFKKTSFYKLEFGDFMSLVLHDYYNKVGVNAKVLGQNIKLYGDDHLNEPDADATRALLQKALTTSLRDLNRSFEAGQKGNGFRALIDSFKRENTKAKPFSAQTLLPKRIDLPTDPWKCTTTKQLFENEDVKEALMQLMPKYAKPLLDKSPDDYKEIMESEVYLFMIGNPVLFLKNALAAEPYEPPNGFIPRFRK